MLDLQAYRHIKVLICVILSSVRCYLMSNNCAKPVPATYIIIPVIYPHPHPHSHTHGIFLLISQVILYGLPPTWSPFHLSVSSCTFSLYTSNYGTSPIKLPCALLMPSPVRCFTLHIRWPSLAQTSDPFVLFSAFCSLAASFFLFSWFCSFHESSFPSAPGDGNFQFLPSKLLAHHAPLSLGCF